MGFKMGAGSDLLIESANKQDDLLQEMNRLTSSELISLLKSTFLSREFAMVERVVVDRETKLKLEIEDLKKDCGLLKQKYDDDVLDTREIQNELNATKHECWELKEINSHLVEERKIAHEKVKKAEEKCLKTLHDMKRSEKEKEDETIIELRSKNCELEFAKAKAESEMRFWKRKYDELEIRVRQLETKCEFLMNVETNTLMDGGDLDSQGVGKKSVGEKGMCLRAEKTGEKAVPDNSIGVEDGSACENVVRTEMKAVESAAEHVKTKVMDYEDVKVEGNMTNCNAIKANLETGAGSSCPTPAKAYSWLPCAGSGKAPLDCSIIEIYDSDDENDVCSPERVSAGNGTVSLGLKGTEYSGETSAQNGIGALKRKVDSFLNTDENEKCYDPDLKKVKDSVCGPDGSAAAVYSAEAGRERCFTPVNLDASVLKRSEECSGFLTLNGLTTQPYFSDSSDSDDDTSSSSLDGDDFVFFNVFSSMRDKT